MVTRIDHVVRNSLLSFIDEVFTTAWRGREHEAISLYCFGHLIRHFGTDDLFQNPKQICIQGTVPGVQGKNPKGRVNKDLLIWPNDIRSCWSKDWMVKHSPLCVQEWKVFRPSTQRPKMSMYDIDWLCAFSNKRPDFVGYAISLDLDSRGMRLSVTRICEGQQIPDWLLLK